MLVGSALARSARWNRVDDYLQNADAYVSVFVQVETIEGVDAAAEIAAVDGIVVPGGFGIRGIEGKLGALRWARERQVPTLGICLGLQCMVIEYARNVLGLEDADSTEFDPETASPVIATMAEQEQIVAGEGDLGGTMRLGAQEAKLVEDRKSVV